MKVNIKFLFNYLIRSLCYCAVEKVELAWRGISYVGVSVGPNYLLKVNTMD